MRLTPVSERALAGQHKEHTVSVLPPDAGPGASQVCSWAALQAPKYARSVMCADARHDPGCVDLHGVECRCRADPLRWQAGTGRCLVRCQVLSSERACARARGPPPSAPPGAPASRRAQAAFSPRPKHGRAPARPRGAAPSAARGARRQERLADVERAAGRAGVGGRPGHARRHAAGLEDETIPGAARRGRPPGPGMQGRRRGSAGGAGRGGGAARGRRWRRERVQGRSGTAEPAAGGVRGGAPRAPAPARVVRGWCDATSDLAWLRVEPWRMVRSRLGVRRICGLSPD